MDDEKEEDALTAKIRKEAAEEQFWQAKVAIGRCDYDSLKAIMDTRKFNINGQTANSNGTLLHSAVSTGRQDIMDLLIDNGADVNRRCGGGKGPTALIIAGMENRPVTAAYLISKGANSSAKDGKGLTVIDYINRNIV